MVRLSIVVLAVCVVPFYLLPTVIALRRHNANVVTIAMLNILGGWTLAGWVVALVWARTTQEMISVTDFLRGGSSIVRMLFMLASVMTAELGMSSIDFVEYRSLKADQPILERLGTACERELSALRYNDERPHLNVPASILHKGDTVFIRHCGDLPKAQLLIRLSIANVYGVSEQSLCDRSIVVDRCLVSIRAIVANNAWSVKPAFIRQVDDLFQQLTMPSDLNR